MTVEWNRDGTQDDVFERDEEPRKFRKASFQVVPNHPRARKRPPFVRSLVEVAVLIFADGSLRSEETLARSVRRCGVPIYGNILTKLDGEI